MANSTVCSDTHAIHDRLFIDMDALVCDAYGIKIQKQFINTLHDNVKKIGAMDTIITDGCKHGIFDKVAHLFRGFLFIKQYESEPYHQHQNKAEQSYRVVMS